MELTFIGFILIIVLLIIIVLCIISLIKEIIKNVRGRRQANRFIIFVENIKDLLSGILSNF
jgi:CHASE3 domain sensor protein